MLGTLFRKSCLAAAAVAIAVFAMGCTKTETGEGKAIRVTATTGMVADLASNIGGEHVQVTALMGPGVDPHLYKASPADMSSLSNADVIYYNGLHLEAKLGDVLVKQGREGKRVFAVSETVPEERLREPPEFEGHFDPHIWFDVSLWAETIPLVVSSLSEIAPAHRAAFEANGEAYAKTLAELHEYCKSRIALIPEAQRVLVTAHDAFGYLGQAYDIDVVGLQGISTASEYGLKDVERIVDIVIERQAKAVFVESSVGPRSIEAVVAGCKARGHEVKIGGELFSDAMGSAGTPEGTYIGMVRHNVDTIVEALK